MASKTAGRGQLVMLRGRKNRNNRHAHPSAGRTIPDKLYFRIGEVSSLAHTKPYVLRYWETEFPSLKPAKSHSGHRLYRRLDVEMVLEIKRLLYDEGFTIDGARKYLAGNSAVVAEPKPTPRNNGRELQKIRQDLEDILTIVSRRC